jgi:type II secretory pathway component GspD/PulD (secretin)
VNEVLKRTLAAAAIALATLWPCITIAAPRAPMPQKANIKRTLPALSRLPHVDHYVRRASATSDDLRLPSDEPPESPLPASDESADLPSDESGHDEAPGALPFAEQESMTTPSAGGDLPVTTEPNSDAEELRIPFAEPVDAGQVEVKTNHGLVTLIARDAALNTVLSALAEQHGMNLVCAENITAHISITLNDVKLEDALNSVLMVAGYTWTRRNNIIMVTSIESSGTISSEAQGRELAVYHLDYASASDALKTITGLLSPVGRAFINETDVTDNRKTKEAICVEDFPSVLARIEQYLMEIDQAPRQVLIEAHILKVDLKYEDRNGVNWRQLFNPLGDTVNFQVVGFASATASQAMFASFDGSNLDTLIECLELTTDAKTLASPKVLVVNGQEARFQVGGQLGFRVSTTTQTSTLQSVNFLDVGVVLKVAPRISRDNQILMHVKPEVSSGKVNQDSGLPESETTQVETDTLLPSGRGMLIGGLIQEQDQNDRQKIPWLGDVWIVGKLFQKQVIKRSRAEVVIVLVPRIVPFDPEYQQKHAHEVCKAQEPLLDGPLVPHPRPYEPKMPDPWTNPGCTPKQAKRFKEQQKLQQQKARQQGILEGDQQLLYQPQTVVAPANEALQQPQDQPRYLSRRSARGSAQTKNR